MTAAEDPTTTQDHNETIAVSKKKKRVRFDERCRVRPIRPLRTLEPEVRKTLWYDREEFKAFKKECRSIMKEAMRQLQQAQQKKHKMRRKVAQRKLKITSATTAGSTITTTLSPNSSPVITTPSSSLKTKHLFPPSAFRGLEHFHPKLSLDREERRQEQWEIVLTEQGRQDMARSVGVRVSSPDHDETDTTTTTTTADGPASKDENNPQRRQRLSKEEGKNLLRLAEVSMEVTSISAKEAHKRALRDADDLLHPSNHWTLPWLLPAEEDSDETETHCISLSPSKSCNASTSSSLSPAVSSSLSQSSSTVPETKLKQLLNFAECGGSNPTTKNIRKKVMSRSRTKSLSPVNMPVLNVRMTT